MTEEVLAIGGFFFTVIVLAIGVPLIRAKIRQMDHRNLIPPTDSVANDRLARIEQAVEAMAIEVERVAENQRFVTKLLSEKPRDRAGIEPPRS